jgi:hypothetical protein
MAQQHADYECVAVIERERIVIDDMLLEVVAEDIMFIGGVYGTTFATGVQLRPPE